MTTDRCRAAAQESRGSSGIRPQWGPDTGPPWKLLRSPLCSRWCHRPQLGQPHACSLFPPVMTVSEGGPVPFTRWCPVSPGISMETPSLNHSGSQDTAVWGDGSD